MASISSSSSSNTTNPKPSAADLTKQLRLHEVAIAELNHQPSSRSHKHSLEMASISSSSSSNTTNPKPSAADLTKQLRLHEVAIAELNHQPSSRAVYQKNGNLFFRTTIQTATAMEQKQLESAKMKLKIL